MLPVHLLQQLLGRGGSAGEIEAFSDKSPKEERKKLHSKPTDNRSEWVKKELMDQTPSGNELHKTV